MREISNHYALSTKVGELAINTSSNNQLVYSDSNLQWNELATVSNGIIDSQTFVDPNVVQLALLMLDASGTLQQIIDASVRNIVENMVQENKDMKPMF